MNQPAPKKTALQLLEQYRPQLAEVVPEHIKIDRLVRVCKSQINQNPKLGMCDPYSLMSAVMKTAQLGLEPGVTMHLIPYGAKVNAIPDFKGLVELARRSGQISEIYAETIHENDNFDIQHGLHRDLKHSFKFGEKRGKVIGSYAVARFKDGGVHFVAMDIEQINKIKNRAKYFNKVWDTDFEEMCKKTAIRRLSKLLPLSNEKSEGFHQAVNLELKAELDEPQTNETILIEAGVPLPRSYDKDETAPNMLDKTKALLSEAIKNGFSCKEVFGSDAATLLADCKNDADCITIIEAINKMPLAKGSK